MTLEQIVALLREARPATSAPAADFSAWRASLRVEGDPFVAAMRFGLAAGQLAFAFAGGYQAALRRLLPALPATAFAALLLSEGRRQRPDELQTTLVPLGGGRYRLDGEKSYVTGAAVADPLLVVARNGVAPDGRIVSALLVLPPDLPGIRQEAGRDLGCLTALPHGRARFEGVEVVASMIAPGDGWAGYARPFRTLEDVHVQTAVAAHVVGEALRRDWPAPLVASLAGCLARLAQCAQYAPDDPHGHLLLAAAERELQQAAAQVNELVVGQDDAFARDWRANHLLVALAAPARAARLAKALAVLRAAP